MTSKNNILYCFNNYIHFGLGECNKPVQVKVVWTNGEVVEKPVTILNNKVLFGKIP